MRYTINCTQDGLKQYPMHFHKNYEIMLYLEGRGFMQTEFGKIPFEEGTVIIVPPNIKHGSVSESGFKNISVEGDFDRYLQLDSVLALSDNASQDGKTIAKMIFENRYSNSTYLAALCSAYVCFLMQQFNIESAIKQSVGKVMAKISENAFDSEINLASILSESGYSEDYIRSCFKEVTGKTPNEFLTEIRIQRARFLIDVYKDEFSLMQLAEKCGYNDYAYFSKKFKNVTKMSPREYKKQ